MVIEQLSGSGCGVKTASPSAQCGTGGVILSDWRLRRWAVSPLALTIVAFWLRIPATMPSLSVNIDHVATLRQARLESFPDPVQAAVAVELGGADGITVHLRQDRRHITDRDVELLRATV